MTQSGLTTSGHKIWVYHLMALTTCMVWALTFVSTKVLILAGLTPTAIFILRFVIAYLAMMAVCHRQFRCSTIKDEGLMALAGLTGGSIFYIAQNTALELTYASDVSLLICTSPIFTMVLERIFVGTRLGRRMIVGSVIALFGVGLVVLNGSLTFGSGPVGDLITLCAAVLWALYCLILQRLSKRYATFVITRKVFFYGVITGLPIAWAMGVDIDFEVIRQPEVLGNLLFLGVLASMLCYVLWNSALEKLGPVRTSFFIYLQPLVTIIASMLVLSEPLTIYVALGSILIISGVVLAERQR
ncbi:MAG: DMT family transporter [Bacteroides sp.]|nr:DMT family transporter [Bacteroides sp.]MDE7471538.1 DMT family transporter [Paramuribaculum sp.]